MFEELIRTIVEFSASNTLAALGMIAAIAVIVYVFVLATGIVPLVDNTHRKLELQNKKHPTRETSNDTPPSNKFS